MRRETRKRLMMLEKPSMFKQFEDVNIEWKNHAGKRVIDKGIVLEVMGQLIKPIMFLYNDWRIKYEYKVLVFDKEDNTRYIRTLTSEVLRKCD